MTIDLNPQTIGVVIAVLTLLVSIASLITVVVLAMLGYLIRSILGLNRAIQDLREDVIAQGKDAEATVGVLNAIQDAIKDLYNKWKDTRSDLDVLRGEHNKELGK